MNFKQISKRSLYAAACGALMLGMFSCSSDEPENGGETSSTAGDFYATVSLDFATRSQTTPEDGETISSDGEEVGKDYENKVNSVLILLYNKDNEFVTAALSDAAQTPAQSSGNVEYQIRFKSDALKAYENQALNMYAVCNPTKEITEAALKEADNKLVGDYNIDQDITVGETTADSNCIWVNNRFLMSNVKLAKTNTFDSYETLVKEHSVRTNPFDLGSVDVQRVAARIDYSVTPKDDKDVVDDNKFAIKNHTTGDIYGYVEIDGLALLNIAKQTYVFSHVSDDGTDKDWTILGREWYNSTDNTGNWVVSPNFGFKQTYAGTGAANLFYSALENVSDYSALSFTEVSKLSEDDNESPWNHQDNYKIWRYVTENTIPVVEKQKAGITTTVIFRAKMTGAEGTPLATAINGKKTVYSFNGIIYGSKDDLKLSADADPNSLLNQAYYATFTTDKPGEGEGNNVAADLTDSNELFTIYTPDASGNYYCYYPYYIRHNDNNNPAQMGIMEFGVVRNNIYKLKVSQILQFGKELPDPNTDDEDPTPYFSVDVKVMNWNVRLNNGIIL